jgi:hypothetical protein
VPPHSMYSSARIEQNTGKVPHQAATTFGQSHCRKTFTPDSVRTRPGRVLRRRSRLLAGDPVLVAIQASVVRHRELRPGPLDFDIVERKDRAAMHKRCLAVVALGAVALGPSSAAELATLSPPSASPRWVRMAKQRLWNSRRRTVLQEGGEHALALGRP